jgi:hypothetical protein
MGRLTDFCSKYKAVARHICSSSLCKIRKREQHVVFGSSGYRALGLPLLALLPFCPDFSISEIQRVTGG